MMITKKRRRRRKREKQFGYRRFSQRAHAGGLVFLSPLPPFPGFWIICFTGDGKEDEKKEKWPRFSSFPRLIRPGSPSFFVYFFEYSSARTLANGKIELGKLVFCHKSATIKEMKRAATQSFFFSLASCCTPENWQHTLLWPKEEEEENWNEGGVNARSNNMRGGGEEEAALFFRGKSVSLSASSLRGGVYIRNTYQFPGRTGDDIGVRLWGHTD